MEALMRTRPLHLVVMALANLLGVAAFLAPFLHVWLSPDSAPASTGANAPLLLTALVIICALTVVFEAQDAHGGAISVALLGVLTALNASLRFIEVTIPGPGGFTPIFALIVLAGYVYGGSFGLLLGALTLLVSAIITGGVGPWLPYQMVAAGWVGLSAPLCRWAVWAVRGAGRRREILVLALFGALWGFAYGAIMNLSFWPYTTGPAAQYWAPGVDAWETLRRYAVFYLATSFAWDAFAAAGNVVLIAALGAPVLRVLQRFRRRLVFVTDAAPRADVVERPS
jgi:energy-coupling factor transport system substrate-specific component